VSTTATASTVTVSGVSVNSSKSNNSQFTFQFSASEEENDDDEETTITSTSGTTHTTTSAGDDNDDEENGEISQLSIPTDVSSPRDMIRNLSSLNPSLVKHHPRHHPEINRTMTSSRSWPKTDRKLINFGAYEENGSSSFNQNTVLRQKEEKIRLKQNNYFNQFFEIIVFW